MRFDLRTVFPLAALLAVAAILAPIDRAATAGRLKGDILPVLSSTDAVGKVTPCGCHTPKGGLARIASLVDSTRLKYGEALVVEAGDFAPDPERPEERARLGFYLRTLEEIGYDAVGVGERELAFGVDELVTQAKAGKLPVLSANLVDVKTGKPLFARSVIVDKGGVKVGVFSVMTQTAVLRGDSYDRLRVDEPFAAAEAVVADLRAKCDVIVALAHLGRAEGDSLAAKIPGIDVVVLSHRPGFVAQGRHVGTAITVASGEQIQNIGYTLLTLDGKKVKDSTSEVRILLPEVGENVAIAAKVKAFEDGINAEVRKQQQANAVQNAGTAPGSDQYMGSENCMSCHPGQYEQWKTTQHAHAFATLERVQKDATPECVQCHVVGFARPGGCQSASASMKLENVGCESCHGYGTQHDMFASTDGKVAEAVCITCHTPANDPGWNYAAKLPRVSH